MNKERLVNNIDIAESYLKDSFQEVQNQEVKRRIKHILDKVTNLKAGVKEDIFKEE